jgi:hypothetical protein
MRGSEAGTTRDSQKSAKSRYQMSSVLCEMRRSGQKGSFSGHFIISLRASEQFHLDLLLPVVLSIWTDGTCQLALSELLAIRPPESLFKDLGATRTCVGTANHTEKRHVPGG